MPSTKHYIGISHALDGINHAFSHHPNFRIHLLISILALLLGLVFQISALEFILLAVLIFMGLVVEMLNTAIESVVDLVTQEWRQSAKLAKDIASGAMLIYALGATFAASLIFIPKFLSQI